MFTGSYNFFDYKHNIRGYNGQDYMSPVQYIMTALGIALVIYLLYKYRNNTRQQSKKMFLILGIVMTALYIFKTSWEAYYDITTGRGFNLYALPFDTCSIVMMALIGTGVAKENSFFERVCVTWLATIGFAGGVANMIFLRGLNFYPMFTFGGLYSYFWHIAMFFVALYIPITKFHIFSFKDSFIGMICLLACALVVIPFNYIINYDFMLLNGGGGAPLLEGVCASLIKNGLRPLSTLLMLVTYYLIALLMVSIYQLFKKIEITRSKKKAL